MHSVNYSVNAIMNKDFGLSLPVWPKEKISAFCKLWRPILNLFNCFAFIFFLSLLQLQLKRVLELSVAYLWITVIGMLAMTLSFLFLLSTERLSDANGSSYFWFPAISLYASYCWILSAVPVVPFNTKMGWRSYYVWSGTFMILFLFKCSN